jgi:hypothetical protein
MKEYCGDLYTDRILSKEVHRELPELLEILVVTLISYFAG